MIHSLLDDFKNFMKIINEYDGGNSIDLTSYNFLGTATLLPLFAYANQNNINKLISQSNNPLTLLKFKKY
ncbi:MAG: hypothetical protein LBC39_02025 [Methanobrevibacter sp.]|jgi:hypothetical protein|nr:hypothetical protein [Candidatus Methanovirga aequatorialis]